MALTIKKSALSPPTPSGRRVRYTETIKYLTVYPIYLIKWLVFEWLKKYIKVIKNLLILLYFLKYIRYQSPRSLSPKFSLVLKIPAFKLGSFHFYFIKEPFFGIFNFDTLQNQGGWKILHQNSMRTFSNIFK